MLLVIVNTRTKPNRVLLQDSVGSTHTEKYRKFMLINELPHSVSSRVIITTYIWRSSRKNYDNFVRAK